MFTKCCETRKSPKKSKKHESYEIEEEDMEELGEAEEYYEEEPTPRKYEKSSKPPKDKSKSNYDQVVKNLAKNKKLVKTISDKDEILSKRSKVSGVNLGDLNVNELRENLETSPKKKLSDPKEVSVRGIGDTKIFQELELGDFFYVQIHIESIDISYKLCDDFGSSFKPYLEITMPGNPTEEYHIFTMVNMDEEKLNVSDIGNDTMMMRGSVFGMNQPNYNERSSVYLGSPMMNRSSFMMGSDNLGIMPQLCLSPVRQSIRIDQFNKDKIFSIKAVINIIINIYLIYLG